MATTSDIAQLKGEMQSMEVCLKGELKAAIAWSSNKTILAVLGILVPLMVASGVIQHFWK